MPNIRLIPVVVFAAICLLAIKTVGFIGDGAPAHSARSTETGIWERVAGGKPRGDEVLITGATPEAKPPPAPQAPMAALPKGGPAPGADKGKDKDKDASNSGSQSERALIERLQERRQELEARSRDLEMRENLIKAAEKQLDGRIDELKELEGKGADAPARIKSIVVMYESMGPKEAARIFDRLDSKTLVELVNQMNPRKVSEIMAKMQPEAAERLTVEMARRKPASEQALPATDLKRIDAKNAR
jgi:flagellar motility protein MotE (MotC chaperone)